MGLRQNIDCHGHEQNPYHNSKPYGFLLCGAVDLVERMHHFKVSIDCYYCQEEDASTSVEGDHKQHDPAWDITKVPVVAFQEVMSPEGEAEDEQEVGQGQVEEINGAGLP
ncbi:hypothetical protein NDU88_006320 [Pleurodeles waltl]|uniref:Uncharacterized protein n=1 Tax=Pleurodeles waltl TaxID=8319 RepID=A0AAV7LZX0_PLEWA|nr:hypothetical protein NDU88_006320 [Pleurodeles waltl]